MADVHGQAQFYATARGAVAARLLRERLAEFWPNLAGQSVLGLGYPLPYLRLWRETAARCVAVIPAQTGAARWPAGAPNLTCTAEEDALPFPDLLFDRVLLIHGLETAENARRLLRELWRVLKDDGRLLIVAPNRSGPWAYLEIDAVRPRPALFLGPARPAAGGRTVPGGAARHRTLSAALAAAGDPARGTAVGTGGKAGGAGPRRGHDHRGGEGRLCRAAAARRPAPAPRAGGSGVGGALNRAASPRGRAPRR